MIHFHHQRSDNKKRLLLFKQEVVSSKQFSNIDKVMNGPSLFLFMSPHVCNSQDSRTAGAALLITLIYALDS